MRALLLLLLPVVALASMDIRLSGKVFFEEKYIGGTIQSSGFDEREITEDDRTAFKINDEDLKSAIETFYGKKPDQVFLTRNTPWGDLHERLGVTPIKVKIEEVVLNLIEITSQKEALTRSIYENEHSEPKKIYIQESATTYDTLTAVWTNPQKISGSAVSTTLNFKVDEDVAWIQHAFSFGLNRTTAEKKDRSQSGSLSLAPGEKLLAQLEAKKGKLKFQILYKVSLSGGVTVNYNEEYKNEHFHSFDINLLTGNRTLNVFETLLYDFYYGQILKIINPKDGYTVLKSFAPEGETSSGQKRRSSAAKHAAETGQHITKKAAMMPMNLTDEDLKSIVKEPLQNELDEESSESSEYMSANQSENKIPA